MDYVVLCVSILNLLLLIGIAGSVAKILNYLRNEENEKAEWAEVIRSRRVFDSQNRSPNYSDPAFSGPSDERAQNWDGMPRTNRNWDGLPATKE
jgi:hypothetical protein